MNKQNKKIKRKNFRVCCLSKKYVDKKQLIRITKSGNGIFINDENTKGRSVYFLIDEVRKVNPNKLFNTLKGKLKFDLDSNSKLEIEKILK